MGHNYTNYSKHQTAPVEPAVEQAVEPETVELETVEPAVEPETVEPETVEPEEESTDPVGIVTKCMKLNVRKEPNTNAEVITTLVLDTCVTIDEAASTEEFYKVYTGAGIEGFCMKKFIALIHEGN